MMTEKKSNVVRVAALATLVFACPRSGKNNLLVEDVAGKMLLPNVVHLMAVSGHGTNVESSRSSTIMVGNLSVEISKAFHEGNVENHFNNSVLAKSDIIVGNANSPRPLRILKEAGFQNTHCLDINDAFYIHRFNQLWWSGSNSDCALDKFGQSGQKGSAAARPTRLAFASAAIVSSRARLSSSAWLLPSSSGIC